MDETKTMFDDRWAAIELDEDLYSRDAVYGAAYVFLERCYLFLERAGDQRIRVRLRGRAAGSTGEDARALAGELGNELLAQAWRRRIAVDRRAFIETIAARALAGAAGPPGLDDLLAMDIGDETAFEDPLGIAMSWEEKYAKKKPDRAGAEEKAADPAPEAPAAKPEAGPKDEGGG
jgi:His-Xaa-Ser system protein HxsD